MDAYAELVRAHEHRARRLAMLLCGPADGDDAVQDALVKGWRSLPDYRGDAPFGSWLLRIVANEAKNRRRSAGRRTTYELRTAPLDDPVTPEAAAVAAEQRRAVLDAVSSLPEQLRDAVACRHLLGLSEAETAAVLDVPLGTVKSRVARGLARLRTELADG